MEENIIDYGSITVPTKWEDITLDVFSEIERYYQDKDEKTFDIRDVLHILIGKDIDYINSLPAAFLDEIMTHLVFLQTSPKIGEPSNKIEIDGETYTIHFENKLKVGEYVAADSALKGDKHNYAGILGVLCRKEGELYDSKFENEILESRIKMFGKQPVTKVMPLCSFFLQLCITYQAPILLSSRLEEALNLAQQNILSSRKNGDLSILSTKLLMHKVRKLRKYIKTISQTSSSTSPGVLRRIRLKRHRKNTTSN
jgi:hypothetical protein